MIDKETLQKLLARRGESRGLDFKRSIHWETASKDQKWELVKDILAMLNSPDGGRIIVGVEDGTYEAAGLSEDEARSFDQTRLNDFLQRYSDPIATCDVQQFNVNGRRLVVIDIPEFRETPILCKADANSSQGPSRLILKRGALYIRTEKATSEMVSTSEEMRELVGRALIKRGDHLLRTIEALIKGHPVEATNQMKGYEQEIDDARVFFVDSDLATSGHWQLYAMPIPYRSDRIPSPGNISTVLSQSEVALRGWDFPRTDEVASRNFAGGRQSVTRWESPYGLIVEAYRAFKSGLFAWRGNYWNESANTANGGHSMSFISIIYQVTEFFLFASRYYARVAEEAGLWIEIVMTNTKGRRLVSPPTNFPLFGAYTCLEEKITVDESYTVSEIRASPELPARGVIKRIFEMFNWNDAGNKMIDGWQTKLLKRQY